MSSASSTSSVPAARYGWNPTPKGAATSEPFRRFEGHSETRGCELVLDPELEPPRVRRLRMEHQHEAHGVVRPRVEPPGLPSDESVDRVARVRFVEGGGPGAAFE